MSARACPKASKRRDLRFVMISGGQTAMAAQRAHDQAVRLGPGDEVGADLADRVVPAGLVGHQLDGSDQADAARLVHQRLVGEAAQALLEGPMMPRTRPTISRSS